MVDDGNVLAIITGDHQIQVESDGLECVPVLDNSVDRLLMGEHGRFAHFVPGDRVADQLFGECEVALVPHHEVVELDHLACGAGGCHRAATARRKRSDTCCTRREKM